MSFLSIGITTLLLCSPIFLLAWRVGQKGNYQAALRLILLGALLLRLNVVSDPFLHKWDERYHALVAKNLIEDPSRPVLYANPLLPYDYRNWAGNQVWVHKQPLPLYIMAGSMAILGIHELALRLPSLLLSLLAVWLTYLIGRRLFNPSVALLAAFLHAIHGLILELTGGRVATDHVDLFFLFFIEWAVYLALIAEQDRKTWLLSLVGMVTGLAVLVKWLPALILFPIWFMWRWKQKDIPIGKTILDMFIMLLFCVATFLPWQWYIHTHFPNEAAWEQAYNTRHLFEPLEGHNRPVFFHLDRLRLLFGEPIYPALILFGWMAIRRRAQLGRIALLIWVLIPLIFFTLAQTKMQAYMLFTAPALFLITAWFWRFLKLWRKKQKLLVYGLATTVLLLTLALPIRYSLERLKPFSTKDRYPAWVQATKELDTLPGSKKVVFHTERYIEAMFYNEDLVAYPYIPNQEALEKLVQQGYTVYISNPPKSKNSYPEQVKFLALPE